ncbi:hypothetical protein [Mumia quercus]|uniref:hypothetical protein n=1 Tax=Mumia quercus TaxID=2976125 RepID=UPI0021D0E609|nr:hypothetical protein [Mumia quercus]
MKLPLGVLAVVLGLLTACSATDAKDALESSPASTRTTATEDPWAEELADATTASRSACAAVFSDLLSTLEELGSRLGVGLRVAEYGTEVGDIRVAYDQAAKEAPTLDDSCLAAVGLKLERALNHYVKANRLWSECATDFDCDMDDVDPLLQERWRKARAAVDEAATAIESYALREDDQPARS